MLTDEYLDGGLLSERMTAWIERLTHPKPAQRVVLAEVEHQLAGFACAFGREDPELGTLLDNLHVSAGFQRQGIGASLFAEIAIWCEATFPEAGLHLWVLEANSQARRFYDGLGGERVRTEIWQAPDGGALPSLCYAWNDLAVLKETLRSRLGA